MTENITGFEVEIGDRTGHIYITFTDIVEQKGERYVFPVNEAASLAMGILTAVALCTEEE